ncbi:Uma2 family endonuclease [Acidithiobacillus sp. M4-SHS-6]|uniref:Uma2 family endonuclease n=1 Tax=Acidithiobacillus sp. M4-SHS-6 TaxID=3383024 RepID=UPI0039BDA82A
MTTQSGFKAMVSVQDYLDGEQTSDIKHEYLAGQVLAMAGASDRHGLIAMALGAALHPLARKRGCQLFMADMKVRVDDGDDTYFYYPDLLLSCDPEDRPSPYYRAHPCLIVEIASPSTARIDRREKRFAYRNIAGLREYLIIDQDVRRVDIYRYPEGIHDTCQEGSFRLACLDADIRLETIYADVE